MGSPTQCAIHTSSTGQYLPVDSLSFAASFPQIRKGVGRSCPIVRITYLNSQPLLLCACPVKMATQPDSHNSICFGGNCSGAYLWRNDWVMCNLWAAVVKFNSSAKMMTAWR